MVSYQVSISNTGRYKSFLQANTGAPHSLMTNDTKTNVENLEEVTENGGVVTGSDSNPKW